MEQNKYYIQSKEKAKAVFDATKRVYCPYFKQEIVFNADGFHHLQFSARRERRKSEQILKFNLVSFAVDIIRSSGTVQEYRRTIEAHEKKSKRTGLQGTKQVEYWALIALVGEKIGKVRVILRRIGDGNIIFWSVMRDSKIKNKMPKHYSDGIEEI